MNRGNIYFDLNKDDLALKDYYAALSLNLQKNQEQSQIHKLYCNLGSIYGRRGVLDSSIYYLEKSLAIDSTFADAWLNHALAISALGNWKMAISDYERYLRYFPEDADIHSDIGVCYQNLNDYNESILWFNKAIFLNPGNGLYLLNRSFSYNALNKPENAKQDAIQARNAGTAIPPSYAQSLGL
jgi:tetratricopeptide (TPR) repeat protein